jgi:hypothetical protein
VGNDDGGGLAEASGRRRLGLEEGALDRGGYRGRRVFPGFGGAVGPGQRGVENAAGQRHALG